MIEAIDWRDDLADLLAFLQVPVADVGRAVFVGSVPAAPPRPAPARFRHEQAPGSLDESVRAVARDEVRSLVRDELRAALAEHSAPGAAPGPFLTVAQAAEVAAVTPDTIRLWIKQGRLQRHHAGRELRVRRDNLEAFLASPVGDAELTPEAAVARILGRTR